MRRINIALIGAFLMLGILNSSALAAADAKVAIVMQPLRYAEVSGDTEKFREMHWIREGYEGGLEELSYEGAGLPADVTASLYVHSLPRANDHEVEAEIAKEGLGYVRLYYQEFSKYYDDNGGVFDPFPALSSNSLSRDLELEIGRFAVEAGITPEDVPFLRILSFRYERRFKDGVKSRLTWTSVSDGGLARNIGPSAQEIDEIVDIFEVRLVGEVQGFEIEARTRWEFQKAELSREEQSLSTTAAAASRKIRVQVQNPESQAFSQTLEAERWFDEDKVFAGTAYNFTRLTAQETEDIFELNAGRTVTNFNNPKQVRDARADNDYDAHTWVANLMLTPLEDLNLTTKFKSEIVDRHGNSTYPQDTTLAAVGGAIPNGIIDTTEVSSINNHLRQFGEALALRYTGIPRTALYTELELEQIHNWLSEDRNSLAGESAASINEIFGRETVTESRRGTFTAGARIHPHRAADGTVHFRYRRDNNDYDDERETDPRGSTARSAFFDQLNITLREVAVRLTLKPHKKVRTTFRYKGQMRDYVSRIENLDPVETDMNIHIFSYDVSLEPLKKLIVMTSVIHQRADVKSPAASSTAAETPHFNFDYTSWFINGEYQAHERVSVWTSLMVTLASNFNDFNSTGLPLGADYTQFDLSTGLRIRVGNHVTLEPRYDYFTYNPNPETDSSDYHAHMISLQGAVAWG